ncbi:MAG: hypothetical protein KDA20_10170 [Phycisphaerales bacterium]|nr:hypothetical protein [Phycisphaerales bacterium]
MEAIFVFPVRDDFFAAGLVSDAGAAESVVGTFLVDLAEVFFVGFFFVALAPVDFLERAGVLADGEAVAAFFVVLRLVLAEVGMMQAC